MVSILFPWCWISVELNTWENFSWKMDFGWKMDRGQQQNVDFNEENLSNEFSWTSLMMWLWNSIWNSRSSFLFASWSLSLVSCMLAICARIMIVVFRPVVSDLLKLCISWTVMFQSQCFIYLRWNFINLLAWVSIAFWMRNSVSIWMDTMWWFSYTYRKQVVLLLVGIWCRIWIYRDLAHARESEKGVTAFDPIETKIGFSVVTLLDGNVVCMRTGLNWQIVSIQNLIKMKENQFNEGNLQFWIIIFNYQTSSSEI